MKKIITVVWAAGFIVALLVSVPGGSWSQSTADSSATPSYPVVSKRNPWAAFGLSCLLPSLGQFYNHEKTKGKIILGIYLPSVVWYGCTKTYDPNTGAEGYPLVPTLVIMSVHIWSIIDAPRSAKRINRLNGYGLSKSPSLQLGVYPSPRDPKKYQVGLVLKKGF